MSTSLFFSSSSQCSPQQVTSSNTTTNHPATTTSFSDNDNFVSSSTNPHLILLIGPGAQNVFLQDVRTQFSSSSDTSGFPLLFDQLSSFNQDQNQRNQGQNPHIRHLHYLTSSTAAVFGSQFFGLQQLTLAVYDVDLSVLRQLRCLLLSWSASLRSLRLYIRLGSNTDYFPHAWANSGRLLLLLDSLNHLKRLTHLTVVLHHPIFSTNVNAAEFLDLRPFFSSAPLREFNFSTLDDVRWTPIIDWLLLSEYSHGKCNGEGGTLRRIAIGNPDEHFTVFNRLLAFPRLARKVVELPNLGCRAGSAGGDGGLEGIILGGKGQGILF